MGKFFRFPTWRKLKVLSPTAELQSPSPPFGSAGWCWTPLSWSCPTFQTLTGPEDRWGCLQAHGWGTPQRKGTPGFQSSSRWVLQHYTKCPSGRWLNCRALLLLTSSPHEKLLFSPLIWTTRPCMSGVALSSSCCVTQRCEMLTWLQSCDPVHLSAPLQIKTQWDICLGKSGLLCLEWETQVNTNPSTAEKLMWSLTVARRDWEKAICML